MATDIGSTLSRVRTLEQEFAGKVIDFCAQVQELRNAISIAHEKAEQFHEEALERSTKAATRVAGTVAARPLHPWERLGVLSRSAQKRKEQFGR
jgi:histidinol dehydrogenase